MVDLICAIKNQNEMSSGALQTGRLLQNRWSTNPQKKNKKNKTTRVVQTTFLRLSVFKRQVT